jgi:hypothetical protein
MDFWSRHRWHHAVHLRLKERLAYLFCSVRPFYRTEVVKELAALAREQKLGSIRAFQIFGPVDLIVRAWLPPLSDSQFNDLLQTNINGLTVNKEFLAREICCRWYWRGREADALGTALDELTIDRVTEAQKDEPSKTVADSLLSDRLLIEAPVHEDLTSIRFFIGVEVNDHRLEVHRRIIQYIRDHLSEQKIIQYWSLYHGMGNFSFLLKGQVQTIDYFEVGKLGDDISREFKHLELKTETYLVHGAEHLYRDERIGRATFDAIEGVDLFVQTLVPQLYRQEQSRTERMKVERFLRQHAFGLHLSNADKKLIATYITGYVSKRESQMATAVYEWFAPLEMYLRDNYQRFINTICKQQVGVKEIEAEARNKIAKGVIGSIVAKHTLRHFLEACVVAVVRCGGEASFLASDLNVQDFVSVRNDAAHFETRKFVTDWESALRIVLNNLPAIEALISAVEKATGNPYLQT